MKCPVSEELEREEVSPHDGHHASRCLNGDVQIHVGAGKALLVGGGLNLEGEVGA